MRGASAVAPPSFVHDLNTCVGCHACVLACANENRLAPGGFWRQIVSINPERRPGLPTFHLSLACNHCLDAPCLRYCPALAISRDSDTGAVLIDEGACIGCRYCSWVCPYDAPRFNEAQGVMQKCTLCVHRLRDGLQPACASLCPTGALQMGEYVPGPDPVVPGFARAGVRPAIRFVPLTRRAPLEPDDPAAVARAEAAWQQVAGDASAAPRRVSLQSEWTLALFTFTAIVLVAWMAAWAMGGPAPPPWAIGGLGLGAMTLSTLHLGRRERAWRAMRNWRRSWLSREVIAYPTFVVLALASLLAGPGHVAMVGAALCAGLACLVSMDQVYVVMARARRTRLDDLAATSSAAYVASVLAAWPWVAASLGIARLVGFAARRLQRAERPGHWWLSLALGRVVAGLAPPIALLLTPGPAAWSWAVAAALVAEAVDRADFYDAL